jgi:hypothetical protein
MFILLERFLQKYPSIDSNIISFQKLAIKLNAVVKLQVVIKLKYIHNLSMKMKVVIMSKVVFELSIKSKVVFESSGFSRVKFCLKLLSLFLLCWNGILIYDKFIFSRYTYLLLRKDSYSLSLF